MRYKVSISSTYADVSCYAFMAECECLDQAGLRCGFLKYGDGKAASGPKVDIRLETPECSSVELFLFVVPVSVPTGRRVDACPSFPVSITVDDSVSAPRRMDLGVNVWSGTNFSVRIP